MGNRCYVAFPEAEVAVYLHWNGGLESVLAFLDFMNERGDRGETYGAARFCQVVGNFFGGTLSVGVTGCPNNGTRIAGLSDENNGAFVVGVDGDHKLTVTGWYIQGRKANAADLQRAMKAARAHAYHKPDADGLTLLDTIRAKNLIPADQPKVKA